MNLIYDDVTVYIILFFVALIASAIDAIAGGGGLLVVPTMLLLGMNPLVTLGTNKLQSCFGTATSSFNYYKNGLLKEKNIYFAQTKDYYFMGGWNEESPLKIFDLKSNLLGTSPDIEYAKNFCKFKKEI